MRPAPIAVILALALPALAAAPATAAPHGSSVRVLEGFRTPSGKVAFRLGSVPVRAVVAAHVRLGDGRRQSLRLRRVRAGTRAGTVRLRLAASGARRPRLVVRVDRRPPSRPRRLRAASGDGRLKLIWTRASDRRLRGYRVLRDGRPVARTGGATSKTITGLENGRSYTFSVVAVDAAGNVSPASSPVSATPEPAAAEEPASPSLVAGPAQDPAPEQGPGAGAGEHPSADPLPVTCDRFAAPGGSDAAAGTAAAPLATAQRLLDALQPGQTGCLREGTYRQYELRAHHGGTPAARVTLASAPGEHATIVVDTDVYLPVGITDVTVRDLTITNDPASGITQAVMIQDFSDRSVWQGNEIDGNSDAHCMELGWAGHGTAHDTLIRRNRFHDCGDPANGNQEHAIYVSQSVGATITENVFWNAAAYTIHLYPSADRTLVTHNVIVGSGYGGVIFASDQDPGTGRISDDNTVAFNVIADGRRFGMEVFWGASGVGTGNAAHDNCVAGNAAADIPSMPAVALADNPSRPVAFADAAHHDYRLAPGDPCLGVVGYDTAALLAAA